MTTDITKFAFILDALFGENDVEIPHLFRLSDMKPDDAEEFRARWESAPEERREIIARHLADLSEESFEVEFSPVFADLLQDENAAVRVAALDGLWDSENTNVVSTIIRLMQSDDSLEVRHAAAKALAHYVLLGEWGQISSYVRDRVVNALHEQHVDSRVALPVRCAALEGMGASGDERVPPLIEAAYESGDYDLQVSALFAMGNSADERWLGTVLDEMESPYADMRAEAARAAGGIGDSEAITTLAQLAYDEDGAVQIAAVTALAKVGGNTASRILNEMLEDPELDHLQELIEEAIEEMDWMSKEIDFDHFDND